MLSPLNACRNFCRMHQAIFTANFAVMRVHRAVEGARALSGRQMPIPDGGNALRVNAMCVDT